MALPSSKHSSRNHLGFVAASTAPYSDLCFRIDALHHSPHAILPSLPPSVPPSPRRRSRLRCQAPRAARRQVAGRRWGIGGGCCLGGARRSPIGPRSRGPRSSSRSEHRGRGNLRWGSRAAEGVGRAAGAPKSRREERGAEAG